MSEPFDGQGWGETSEGLPVCTGRVIRLWTQKLQHEHPWRDMPRDDVTGEIRGVIVELVNAAWDSDEEGRRRRIAAAARVHGEFRLAQGCPKSALGSEFSIARDSIAVALRAGRWSDWLVRDTIQTLLPDLRLARQAAERGYEGRAVYRAYPT